MKEILIKNTDDLSRAADEFISCMGAGRIFAFAGPMGVGKTTFISALCHRLGVEADDISSPTFAIVNEYRPAQADSPIYHFDCYRLSDDREAFDMGIEDYFESGALCLIEWPDRIENFLPADAVIVEMEELSDGSRRMCMRDCGE